MALECFSEAENPLLKLKSVPNLLQQDITDSISKLTEHQVGSTKIRYKTFFFGFLVFWLKCFVFFKEQIVHYTDTENFQVIF